MKKILLDMIFLTFVMFKLYSFADTYIGILDFNLKVFETTGPILMKLGMEDTRQKVRLLFVQIYHGLTRVKL